MSSLSDLSIKNPVFPVMLCAAMVIFGYLGYRDMGISQFPEIDFPVVSITTTREAASPDIVDGDVTDVIEDAVASVEGIDYISSQSLQGQSVVTVFFRLSRNIDAAMQDVQNAVAAAAARLPNDIDPPIVSKVNMNKFPIMWLAIYGDRKLQDVSAWVDAHFKQQVETIPGCGGLMFGGLRYRNMRIWVDGQRLHSQDLDIRDVTAALRRESVEKPAGYLQSDWTEMNVRTMGECRIAEDYENLIVANRHGSLVRLKDLGITENGLADKRGLARFNSMPTVGVGVMRAQGANVVDVCNAVKKRLPDFRRSLPDGMQIGISTDYSLFIKSDVDELKFTLLMGVALTSLVTFLFLGSLGTTFNIMLSIPTSLMGTFCALRYLGFTINFMTLLALSLSVGVVVDDAILVLENIYRRAEHGEPRRTAATLGAREITFAAIAATVSIIAIFLPVAFLEGSIGLFFFQFGVTVSIAVFLSLITSLTLTPMLCALFLKVRKPGRKLPRPFGGPLGWLATASSWSYWLLDRWLLEPLLIWPMDRLLHLCGLAYHHVLHWSLRLRWLVVAGAIGLMALAVVFVVGASITLPASFGLNDKGEPRRIAITPVGKELVPSEDQNRFVVNVYCPVGMSIDYVDEALQGCETVLRETPEVASFFTAISIRPGQMITEGLLFCRLHPVEDRPVDRTTKRYKTQGDLINELRGKLTIKPGLRVTMLDLSTQGFTATRGYPIDFAVQGPDWDEVARYSQQIINEMQDSGLVSDINSDYRPGMPEVQVKPNRQKAADLGVNMRDLAFTINATFGGVRVGRFTTDGKRNDVRVRLVDHQRGSPWDIHNLYLRSKKGQLVPVSDVTDIDTIPTLPIINRYNHQRKVEITANMKTGVPQGDAIAACQQIAEKILPQGYYIVQLGNAQAMAKTISSLGFALVLGIVVAYMVLGAQFNSFLHPFTVLMAMPFAATGALATLWWFGDTLNLMSMIGLILLMGLVKKNSIILVDYINQLRAGGMPLNEAILTACPVRLRPILMTSVATIAGALPLALGIGPGAETRAPLARGIIGGMVVSTLVTLVVVPVFYLMLDHLTTMFTRFLHHDDHHHLAKSTAEDNNAHLPHEVPRHVGAAATAQVDGQDAGVGLLRPT